MTNFALDKAPVLGDAFGVALLDQFAGLPGVVTYERDDGFLKADPMNYISDWNERDSWAVARVMGRVLDVGAGAGRVCLRLAETGVDQVALDVSAGAVDVCRRRGLPNVFHGTIDDLPSTQQFDTFIVLGNNLGLIGSIEKAQGFFDVVECGCDQAGGLLVAASTHTRLTTPTTSLTTKRTSQPVGWLAR